MRRAGANGEGYYYCWHGGAISEDNDQYSRAMMLFNQIGVAWVFSPLGSRHSETVPNTIKQ